MWQTLRNVFGEGLDAGDLSVAQVACRAVLIFFVTLIVVRTANKRFFAKKTAFDLILGFILASMMARAINGSEKLVPTIVAGFLLALLHRGLGWMAMRWPQFGVWVKGTSQTIVENGQPDRATMRRHHIGDDDLAEELRLQGLLDTRKVKLARLERSGEMSVVQQED